MGRSLLTKSRIGGRIGLPSRVIDWIGSTSRGRRRGGNIGSVGLEFSRTLEDLLSIGGSTKAGGRLSAEEV